MKKFKSLLVFIVVLPFLLSLDPKVYNPNYYAKYKSPEGITFLSYSNMWDKSKLEELYYELMKNKHGEEIKLLQEVRVLGEPLNHSPQTFGQFNMLTNTITLYKGNTFTKPENYRKTLSHEYGHFFSYHYLNMFHFPFSKWAELRGLNGEPIRWDAFWNYSVKYHDWYPEEIMADDYVLLFGPMKKVDIEDVRSNEAFYLKTKHSNQRLSNVLENKQVQTYLENKTGMKIDENRTIITPKIMKITSDSLNFSVQKRANIAYRLNLTVYENGRENHYFEILNIVSNNSGKLKFSLNELFQSLDGPINGHIKVNLDVLDLNTSLGFQTKALTINVRNHQLVDLVE